MAEHPELAFIGIGAARCGTTWLAKRLDAHPDVFIPERKELHFFNNDKQFKRFGINGLARYFPEPDGRLFGEYTPRYLVNRTALERIRDYFPQARILILLRDPVERALSQYRYFRFVKFKEPIANFRDALTGCHHGDYVEKSQYLEQLHTVYELFSKEQVSIGLYEDLRSEPEAFLQAIFAFIGLTPHPFKQEAGARVNSADNTEYAPPQFLAKANRFFVNTDIPILKSKVFRSGVQSLIRAGQQRAAGNHAVFEPPSAEEKAAIFEAYFAADIERLSGLLDRDLRTCWGHY